MQQERKKIYTVAEITREIESLLKGAFPEVWVEGEVTNLTRSAKGHTYFSLKDESALLKCALFFGSGRSVKFKLENGLKVLCFGAITTYAPRGEYQLIVEKLEPQGVGALQLAFEQLKKKLEKEGLFEARYKKPIPFLPDRIGIVTSLAGKAIRDILKVIGERFPESHIFIRDVRVQGEGAAEEIAEAIRQFNTFGKVNVLLVGRGGGSIEDLWAFNEEVVARAIFASAIPVVSCVGHELDYTIADFVADLRCGTPSMAAERVVPDKEELLAQIKENTARLRGALIEKVTLLSERLRAQKENVVFRQPERLFLMQEQHLDELVATLREGLSRWVQMQSERIQLARANLRHLSPRELMFKRENTFKQLLQNLTGKRESFFKEVENRFAMQIEKLESLSPLKVLRRGYSMTALPEGKTLRGTKGLSIGDRVKTRLSDGTFTSRVEDIE